MPARAIRLGILLAGHLILAACYTPYEPACGFVCGSGGTCPDDYTCNTDDNVCHLNGTSPATVCSNAPAPFDVSGAMSVSNVAIAITFDGVPNPAQAQNLANYSIPQLALAGSSMLAGDTITIGTASQAQTTYTVTVTGVTRLTDGAALKMNSATFAGRKPFEVLNATSTSVTSVDVMFNDPPDAAATTAANYSIPSLTVSAASLSGQTVTLTTTAQAAQSYTVTVSNVKRASDGEQMASSTAMFGGRNAFDVASAATVDATHVSVVFDAAPAPTQATTAANYTIPGLSVTAASLAGSTVTLTTSVQRAISYTVTVANVTRASDAEALTTTSADFTGTDYCTDTMLDGDETDADCGGPTCTARCAMGQMCMMASDCSSNNCATTCQ